MLIAFVERRWRRLVSHFCALEPKQPRANIGESSELMCLDPLELFRRHNDGALFTPGSSYHFSPHGHAVLADWL